MASSYLKSYRAQREQERNQKIAQEEQLCSQKLNELNCKKKRHTKYFEGLVKYAVISGFLGIFLYSCGYRDYFGLGIVAPFLLKWLITFINNNNVDSINRNLDNQMALRTQECENQKRSFAMQCDQAVESEKNRYLSETSAARKRYGGSTVMRTLVVWMTDRFEKLIRAADRGIYIDVITAQLHYEVFPDRIDLLVTNPHSGTTSVTDRFSFRTNGLAHYNDLPDFLDRVGFSQALSKQIEVEIAKRFPTDPIKPIQGRRPDLVVDYDDCNLKLTYRVKNPSYQPPVNLGKGISMR